jgi:hypothetical protein
MITTLAISQNPLNLNLINYILYLKNFFFKFKKTANPLHWLAQGLEEKAKNLLKQLYNPITLNPKP